MITSESLDSLLLRLQQEEEERLVSRSICFEGCHPADQPEETWKELSEGDGPTLRAAIRLGLVNETYVHWEPDYPQDYAPDGGDYVVSLTGAGTERLIRLNEPCLRRVSRQLAVNIPTIIVSVLSALAVSWALYEWGAPTGEHAPQQDELISETDQ